MAGPKEAGLLRTRKAGSAVPGSVPLAGARVAAASARPPGGEMRHRQPVSHLMIY